MGESRRLKEAKVSGMANVTILVGRQVVRRLGQIA